MRRVLLRLSFWKHMSYELQPEVNATNVSEVISEPLASVEPLDDCSFIHDAR